MLRDTILYVADVSKSCFGDTPTELSIPTEEQEELGILIIRDKTLAAEIIEAQCDQQWERESRIDNYFDRHPNVDESTLDWTRFWVPVKRDLVYKAVKKVFFRSWSQYAKGVEGNKRLAKNTRVVSPDEIELMRAYRRSSVEQKKREAENVEKYARYLPLRMRIRQWIRGLDCDIWRVVDEKNQIAELVPPSLLRRFARFLFAKCRHRQ
jgi:hypothetical protein